MAVAPALTRDQLRAIFLKPEYPLKTPDDCEPKATCYSRQMEVAIAEHECVDNPYHWIELWATPNEWGHPADAWSVDWRLADESNTHLLQYVSFCPFCGLNLDSQIDDLGYYRFIGHDVDAEVAAGKALQEASNGR